MEKFKIGDLVKCVKVGEYPEYDPIVGSIYRVRDYNVSASADYKYAFEGGCIYKHSKKKSKEKLYIYYKAEDFVKLTKEELEIYNSLYEV